MNDEFEYLEEFHDYQDADDIRDFDVSQIVVYSRDWTIGTFYDQIEQGNIELNPGFQRRNAWNDEKRGKLIESIIKAYPVPEIVLAEDKQNRGSFIVIDGKQRLLTLAGFINHEKYRYWTNPIVKGIKLGGVLNNYSYEDVKKDSSLRRAFENASLRCTVITNYKCDDVLYDIFYRLNAGSTPLSSQELRQALNPGPFSDFLIQITNESTSIWSVMGIREADRRLRDIEVVLRLMAFMRNAKGYHGNLRYFLDLMMHQFNEEFAKTNASLENLFEDILATIERLKDVFGDYSLVGRRYKDNSYESRFNRVIFEVQVYYFSQIPSSSLTAENNRSFVESFKQLCDSDSKFRASIEGSTKNMDNYVLRYTKFEEIVNQVYKCNIHVNPFSDAYIQR